MRVFELFEDLNVVEFDVEELVDRFQHTPNRDIVFELDCYFVVDEGFEKATWVSQSLADSQEA
jgi:hypothetical protein